MVVIQREELPYIHCHISPFGVIPKKSKPGQWRLIVDLSSPENASGIDKDMCSIDTDKCEDPTYADYHVSWFRTRHNQH